MLPSSASPRQAFHSLSRANGEDPPLSTARQCVPRRIQLCFRNDLWVRLCWLTARDCLLFSKCSLREARDTRLQVRFAAAPRVDSKCSDGCSNCALDGRVLRRENARCNSLLELSSRASAKPLCGVYSLYSELLNALHVCSSSHCECQRQEPAPVPGQLGQAVHNINL